MPLSWKSVWRVLKQLKIEPAYNLAIPLLGIDPQTPYPSAELFICVVIAAVQFITARKWNQQRFPNQ